MLAHLQLRDWLGASGWGRIKAVDLQDGGRGGRDQ